ncbi:hypothetical protein BT96DRAFT_947120 [Gymnopus androsaceus JB14]|uniref:Uncharacterized protein n=1 Tax=Gymnopus androsaceus JB14 TaxID=1447944 RepID=A0A6A4GVM6_9AGAR|nr:hypothetical protein BT96DRAFT_947120 [Gymnopus androsaceus JB14]
MPRKRMDSAIYKSEWTEEQKNADKAKSHCLANRQYRRKYKEAEKGEEQIAKLERPSLSEEQMVIAKEKQRGYNSDYYLRHSEDILDRQMKKRAQAYVKKHGESAFWSNYPHRKIKPRKSNNL